MRDLDDTWKRILTELHVRADAAGLIAWDVAMDFTVTVRTFAYSLSRQLCGYRRG
jgi:hypothetical protein